jgi:hypothetical protein
MCTGRAVPSPVVSKDGVDMAQLLELADAPQLKQSYILHHSNPRVTLFCCRAFPIGGNRKASIYKIAQRISINNTICKHQRRVQTPACPAQFSRLEILLTTDKMSAPNG